MELFPAPAALRQRSYGISLGRNNCISCSIADISILFLVCHASYNTSSTLMSKVWFYAVGEGSLKQFKSKNSGAYRIVSIPSRNAFDNQGMSLTHHRLSNRSAFTAVLLLKGEAMAASSLDRGICRIFASAPNVSNHGQQQYQLLSKKGVWHFPRICFLLHLFHIWLL